MALDEANGAGPDDRVIYLDYQATTPLAPEARAAMLPWLTGPNPGAPDRPISEGESRKAVAGWANPNSPHAPGRAAAAAVAAARDQVAGLFPPGGTVVFTSCATEALNLAIRGCGARSIAVSAIEHAAVLDTVQAAASQVRTIPVDGEGVAHADAVGDEGFDLVAVMQANNEIGTIQPVEAFAERAHAGGALFLCDAVQGAGRLQAPGNADMIAVSAHKLHGPKGIGALWLREGLNLAPQLTGGGQEQGLRSGTLSPALCAGFGAAAALAVQRREADRAHVERLWSIASEAFARWTLNGSAEWRWRGNLNLRLDGLDVARLMSEVRQVAFSAGSACASGSGRASHVLRALGLSEAQARSSIRIGFGRYTTEEEIREASQAINAAAAAQGV